MRARVPLRLWPAVDVRGGRTAQATADSPLADPASAVAHWVEQGAERIHLVDLDRATGTGENDALLERLVRGAGVPVEVSGGILGPRDVERALSWGAVAVTTSSALWADPASAVAWLREQGPQVQVGLDLVGDRVVARGTDLEVGPVADLWPLLAELGAQGKRRWVLASAAADGRMTGPDLAGLRAATEHLAGTLIASGGVSTTGDLVALSSLRGSAGPAVGEVILGAALYAGAVELGRSQRLLAEIAGPAEHPEADSAGVSWAGRELQPGEFDDDTGELDPALPAPGEPPLGDAALVAALDGARVFVALLAEEAADSADLSVAQVTTPEGWSALPVFTTADAVGRWRADARPVPVRGHVAAQAALGDGAAALVLDAGSPGPRVVRPSMTSALARRMGWERPVDDPVVLEGLRRLKEHPAVTGVALRAGPSGELVIGLRGLQDDREAGLLVAGVLQDPEVRSRVDGVIVSALGLDGGG
ncbi:HisA/HisF-related TIM barrel protein [Kytococcus sedentarius]|uniref:HisA/HisF-related TIM barrel protein n=1 Tax=Kytococcus sedentarius TaxID=1276 RepID=UPI0035BC8D54